jgi:hypothetical protein
LNTWLQELEMPTPAFFEAFAQRIAEPSGPVKAARDAVQNLTPLVDWAAYLPHIPHGLLGLQSVFRLRPLLVERSFLRLLATQIHAFASEGRCRPGKGLGAISTGSGSQSNLGLALASHRPSLAWGEAMGVAEVTVAAFRRLEGHLEKDMANVGHKAVMAWDLGELFHTLEEPKTGGRVLLALAAWLGASEPFDTFWHQRAAKRLEGITRVPHGPCVAQPQALEAAAREICDAGLVDLLDAFALKVRAGAPSLELLAQLALAASEKQLDARRDLEGKTSWNFVYLAHLAKRGAQGGALAPESWVQAAALVNLFPTDEAEDRPRPAPPRQGTANLALGPDAGLLEAILDAEPLQAMWFAGELMAQGGAGPVLGVLAEAAATNDPGFNHSSQVLAVAAADELLPNLPEFVQRAMLVALAKALANGQGSSDLGRLADRALDKLNN